MSEQTRTIARLTVASIHMIKIPIYVFRIKGKDGAQRSNIRWVNVGGKLAGIASRSEEYPYNITVVVMIDSEGRKYFLSSDSFRVYVFKAKDVQVTTSGKFAKTVLKTHLITGRYGAYHNNACNCSYRDVPHRKECYTTEYLDAKSALREKTLFDQRFVRVMWSHDYHGLKRIHFEKEYTFEELCALKPGDVLFEVKDHPFKKETGKFSLPCRVETTPSWMRYKRTFGWITQVKKMTVFTNGIVHFPLERPFGAIGWKQWSLIKFTQRIHAENWHEMLKAIEGKYFEGVNTSTKLNRAIRNLHFIGESQDRIRKIQGECFRGGTFDECHGVEVGIGERLLFIGQKNNVPVYVIDSPSYGTALYVFTDETVARNFANKRISATKAQESASARVIHVGKWEARASQAIASASVASS